jgi:hypothetical protein
MIELKYRSKQIRKMPLSELQMAATRLMLKINIITGWELPHDIDDIDILKEQFELKLAESFPGVNLDEIEFAFRNNTTVKDWGKNMNLAMIDEVMIDYQRKRREVSDQEQRKEGNLITPALPPPKRDPATDFDFMQSWINEWKLNIHLVSDPTLIPESFFPWLEKNNLLVLTKEQKLDYLNNQAVQYRHYQLSEQIKSEGEHGQAKKDLESFNAMRKEECFTGIEITRLKELAKKIAVYDYLKPEVKPEPIEENETTDTKGKS